MAVSRKETAERLSASERKYRSIFENAVEGIYQSTPEGRFLAVNPALARMHGYASPQEMLAGDADETRQLYVNAEDQARYWNMVTSRGEVRGFETEVYRKDGSRIWISINARGVRNDSGEKIIYNEGMVEDITERKKLEDQLFQVRKMEAIGQLAAASPTTSTTFSPSSWASPA